MALLGGLVQKCFRAGFVLCILELHYIPIESTTRYIYLRQ